MEYIRESQVAILGFFFIHKQYFFVYWQETLPLVDICTPQPQMLINFLIREIIVFDNEIHIYFNNPLQTGPDASQGLSVCDRETTIPAHIQNSYELRRKNIRLTITI